MRGETEDRVPPDRQRQTSFSPSVSARVSLCLLGLQAFYASVVTTSPAGGFMFQLIRPCTLVNVISLERLEEISLNLANTSWT